MRAPRIADHCPRRIARRTTTTSSTCRAMCPRPRQTKQIFDPGTGEAVVSKLIGAVAVWALCASAALAADTAASGNAVPQFAFMNGGWQAAGADFLPPPSGPGPVRDVPGHEHVGNNQGGQPSFRNADLSNPILQPWVRDAL